MSDMQTFRFDDSGIRNLLKVMESEHFVRIGVFGGGRKEAGEIKPARLTTMANGGRKMGKGASGMTNAEVGFKLEYGDPAKHTPARSWLRMPLITKINNIVKDTAKFFEAAVKEGNPIKFLTILGIQAEKQIQLAFDSRGFGSWAANAPLTIQLKGSDAPGIDTAQLRRSVASVVI